MVAVDTNVIIRFLTRDHPSEAARATELFGSEQIWISKTVLLESAWVLGSLYGFEDAQVENALRALAGLPNTQVEDVIAVAQAFDLHAQGLEFADALHLASMGAAKTFATFDAKFSKRAQRAAMPVRSL